MASKKIKIIGMRCVSCEVLLTDEFGRIPGVEKVIICRQTGLAEVEHREGELNLKDFQNIARKFGYDVIDPDQTKEEAKRGSLKDWIWGVATAGGLLVLLWLLSRADILPSGSFNKNSVSYGTAFFVGIAASLSSCLAVVGAVVISFAEKYESSGQGFFQRVAKPNLLFQTGRLAVFFILGGILGLIGGEINISGQFLAIFNIVLAVILIWLGLSILQLMPSLSRLGFHLPRSFSSRWNRLKDSDHPLAPLMLGGFSFFLPCGFTQSMQLFALVSGSFWLGGLTMLIFAFGTLPILLLLGGTASWAKTKNLGFIQKASGFLVIFFAVFLFNSGLALSRVDGLVFSSQPKVEPKPELNLEEILAVQESEKIGDFQEVKMAITPYGFEPKIIKIKKDLLVRWVIDGTQASGCTNQIIVPSLGISKEIEVGKNIVEFIPTKAGELAFSCWMGMVRGKFIVE